MKKMKKSSMHFVSKNSFNLENLYLYLAPITLSIFTFIAYFWSLRYKFQFDDLASITRYYHIRHKTFSELFFSGSRWISYWLNTQHYKIGKFDPFSYRLFNVCLHTATTCLVFYFIYVALTGLKKKSFFKENALAIAFTGAALFALHPVQTQTVSYVIQGQLEGLACFFTMAITLCFLLRHRARDDFKKFLYTCLIFIGGFLGTGTKEIFIVSPFLLLITDWFFVAQGNRKELKNRWVFHLSFFSLVFLIYFYFLKPGFFFKLIGLKHQARNNIGNILTETRAEKILPLHFFISQFKVIVHYIWMFIWPFNICVEYDWKLSKSFFAPDCIYPFLLICSLFAGLYYLLKRDKTNVIGFCAIWFFIVLAPRSTIIPSSELLTDYKTYSGSMAILFLFAICIVYLFSLAVHWLKKLNLPVTAAPIQLALVTLLMIPIGYSTIDRNRVWRSGKEFWGNILKNAPEKARAYNNYAVALSEEGKYKESIDYYLKAIDMDDTYPDPMNNVAVAYSMTKDLPNAIYWMEKTIKTQPNYPEAYNNLASFLIQQNKFDKAEKVLKTALKLRPYYGKAFFNLGKVYLGMHKEEEAFECFKNACTKADLDNASGFGYYARISMAQKRYKDAIFAFSKLIEFEPTADNVFNLGNAYYHSDQYKEAFNCYEKAFKAKPTDNRIAYNLGETAVRLKNYHTALNYFKKADALNYGLPNLPMRIAHCYMELGKKDEAKRTLISVANNNKAPANFRAVAQNELKRLGEAPAPTA